VSKVNEIFDETADFDALLSSADGNAKNDWERKFVDDMRVRYDKYGADCYLSDRQRDVLENIAQEK